ncbi:MAG: DUF2281 domain-containing protein [Oculatellaceae cyanobacterium Prado106]|jgi:hypothetical protein|nr:DUF2281 domain-containing protein [Oculatellaceae cyanobacterium Prado106]
MQSTPNLERSILENLRQLSPAQQQQVLDFTEFLRNKLASPSSTQLTLQQIATLPLQERH